MDIRVVWHVEDEEGRLYNPSHNVKILTTTKITYERKIGLFKSELVTLESTVPIERYLREGVDQYVLFMVEKPDGRLYPLSTREKDDVTEFAHEIARSKDMIHKKEKKMLRSMVQEFTHQQKEFLGSVLGEFKNLWANNKALIKLSFKTINSATDFVNTFAGGNVSKYDIETWKQNVLQQFFRELRANTEFDPVSKKLIIRKDASPILSTLKETINNRNYEEATSRDDTERNNEQNIDSILNTVHENNISHPSRKTKKKKKKKKKNSPPPSPPQTKTQPRENNNEPEEELKVINKPSQMSEDFLLELNDALDKGSVDIVSEDDDS
ncbi:MAG: hypothetical protein GF317_05955 [Candidatus Lokiarchaeota archaeon]|nr:hypothetical protein [Candidatus Lokiarchaeota archaeon]